MIENPLVSVIMPAYNCEKFIRQALDSILQQTYPHLEILVADDASKDRTKQIIDSYGDPCIKRFHNTENLGYLKTWNKLMTFAQGKYITFQDADDYSEKDRIEKLLSHLSKNTKLSVVGSNVKYIDVSNKIRSVTSFTNDHDGIYAELPKKFNIIGSALMIKKKYMIILVVTMIFLIDGEQKTFIGSI